MIKKIFYSLVLFTGLVNAQQVDGIVNDHYRTITKRVPEQHSVCNDVQIPIYRDNNSSGGVILGAIVGNAIGAASGIENGRTFGTVIGGIAGSEYSKNNNQIDHYRLEQRCSNVIRYNYVTEQVYSHSTMTFHLNGRTYNIQFRK